MSGAVGRIASATVGRRPISFAMRLRSIGRAMEHQPFERLPVTQASARGDWPKEIKLLTKKMVIFIPTMSLLLGWPALAKLVMDGHI